MDPQARPVVHLTTSHSKAIFGTTITFLLLATIFVALRLWVGRFRQTPHHIDDYLIFGALILYYGQAACTFVQLFLGGAGHHVEELHPGSIELGLEMLIPIAVLYSIELASIKCSILLMLVRIFYIKPFRMAASMVMTIAIMWGIYAAIAPWALCTPIAFSWNPNIPGGHCDNRQASSYAIAVFDIAVDCLIFLLPLPMIWNLPKSSRDKIAMSLIYSMGIVSIIASGLRANSTPSSTPSPSYLIWTQTTPAIALITASSLHLRPLLDRITPNTLTPIPKRLPLNRPPATEHTFPLRTVNTANTTTTAFAGPSEPSLQDPGWKYTMMDNERALTPANECIRVETRWVVQRHDRPGPALT